MGRIMQRAALVAGAIAGNPNLNDLALEPTALRFWWHNNQVDGLSVNQNGTGLPCSVGEYVGSIASGASGIYTYRLRNHMADAGALSLLRHASGLNVSGNSVSLISSIGSLHPDDSEKLPGSVIFYPKVTGFAAGMRFKYEIKTQFSLSGPTFFAQDPSPALFSFFGVSETKKLAVTADLGTYFETPVLSMNMQNWNNVVVLFLPHSPTQCYVKIYLNGRLVGATVMLSESAISRHTIGAGNTYNDDLLIQSTFFLQGDFSSRVHHLNSFLTYGIPA